MKIIHEEEEETSTFFVADEIKGKKDVAIAAVVVDNNANEEEKKEEEEEIMKKETTTTKTKKITSIAETPELVRLKAKNMLRLMMRKKHDRNQERIEEIIQYLTPIEDEISLLKHKIQTIRSKRNEATEKFVEEQISIVQRQHYASTKIEKLVSKQQMQTGSIVLPQYTKAIQQNHSSSSSSSTSNRSSSSRYVVSWETKLCQAFHQVEVNMKQLEILSKHREMSIQRLKEQIQNEHRTKEIIEENLLKQIKNISLSMASVIMEKQQSQQKEKEDDEKIVITPPKDDSPNCVTNVKQIQSSWNPFF